MREYKGKSVFAGIAIGRIKVYNKSEQQVKRVHIDDTQHEKERYAEAVEKAVEQLQSFMIRHLRKLVRLMQLYLKCIRLCFRMMTTGSQLKI